MDPDAKLDELAAKLTALTGRWQSSPPPLSMDASHPLVAEMHGLLQEVKATVEEGKKQLKAKLQDAVAQAQAKQEAKKKAAEQPSGSPIPQAPSPQGATTTSEPLTLRFEKEQAPPVEQTQGLIESLLAIANAKQGLPQNADILEVLKKLGLLH